VARLNAARIDHEAAFVPAATPPAGIPEYLAAGATFHRRRARTSERAATADSGARAKIEAEPGIEQRADDA
jgi:hypothetical protein